MLSTTAPARPIRSPIVEPEPAETVLLADGSPLRLRPVRRDDAARLRRMFYRLSPATIYRRFHAPLTAPPERGPGCLIGADLYDRYATVALIGDEIVGVARYDRLTLPGEGGGSEAELAIVVEDAWQRRGVGRLLVARLVAAAGRRRIDRFTGTALGDNRPLLGLIGALFPRASVRLRDGEYQLRLRLSDFTPGPSPAVRRPG